MLDLSSIPPIIQYVFFNCLGFTFFLYVWNRIPKPRPDDYTTIPGMKLEMLADDKPPLSIEPGTSLSFVSDIQGHIEEVKKYTNYNQFLQYCNLCYGPLSSFYWGPRYVVTVSNVDLVEELESYNKNLLSICPLAVGSIVAGDPRLSTSVAFSPVLDYHLPDHVDPLISDEKQNEIFMKGDWHFEEKYNPTHAVEFIRHGHKWLENHKNSTKSLKKRLSRPLVVMFDEEIELDAHPIPAFVPIIIHTSSIIEQWDEETVLDQYFKLFHWLPGFTNASIQ